MLHCKFCSKARHSPAASTHERHMQNVTLLHSFLQAIDLEDKVNAIVEITLPVSSL